MQHFSRLRSKLAITAVVFALAIVAFAQSGGRDVRGSSPPVAGGAGLAASMPSPTLENARLRWERLTPDEKVRARERYEKYLALSDAERNEMAERAQRLKDSSVRVQRELSPEVRERFSTLDPAKRHELMGELVAGEAKEKGQRIRGMLPDQVLKRLEAARPEDRARFLLDFKQKQRKRVARYAIDQIGRRLELPQAEIDRLKSLPDDERARAVLELKKELSEREAQEFGLLPGISQREWDAWEALSPEEFYEVMQRYEHMRAAQHVAAGGAGDAADAAGPGTDAALSDDAPPSPESLRALQRLAEARRIRPSDVLDFANLTKAERAARLDERRRERCMAVMREDELLPADRIANLAQTSNPVFFEQVRRLLGPANVAPRRAVTGPAPGARTPR